MKDRLKKLIAATRSEIMSLGEEPVSVLYYDIDQKALNDALRDAADKAVNEIESAFIEELHN